MAFSDWFFCIYEHDEECDEQMGAVVSFSLDGCPYRIPDSFTDSEWDELVKLFDMAGVPLDEAMDNTFSIHKDKIDSFGRFLCRSGLKPFEVTFGTVLWEPAEPIPVAQAVRRSADAGGLSPTANTIVTLFYGGAERGGSGLQSALRDFLTDARHAADYLGLDFEEAVMGSLSVFEEERV